MNTITHRAEKERELSRRLGLTGREATVLVNLVCQGHLTDENKTLEALARKGLIDPIVVAIGLHEQWSDRDHMPKAILYYILGEGDVALLDWWKARRPQPELPLGLRRLAEVRANPLACHAWASVEQFLQLGDGALGQWLNHCAPSLEGRVATWLTLAAHFGEGKPLPARDLVRAVFPFDEQCGPVARAWADGSATVYRADFLVWSAEGVSPSASLVSSAAFGASSPQADA